MKHERFQSAFRAPSTAGLSRSELDRYLRRAHCLRAFAFSRLIGRLAHGFSALFRRLARARDRRSAIADLRRLDRRTLTDIGVERAQIPVIVEHLMAQRQGGREAREAYPLPALVASPTPVAPTEDDGRCPPLAA